jgi:uncharacterized protein YlbG (UPF0298 family)
MKQLFLIIFHFIKMIFLYLDHNIRKSKYTILYLDNGKVELIIKKQK